MEVVGRMAGKPEWTFAVDAQTVEQCKFILLRSVFASVKALFSRLVAWMNC